jgi:hypothetical protein
MERPMNTTKLSIGLVLTMSSLVCFAANQYADTTREQRMDEALQRYRSSHPDPSQSAGTPSESGFKRGVRKTGAAIERGAEKAGNAVKHGLEKTGQAAHRVGDKISEKVNGNKTP